MTVFNHRPRSGTSSGPRNNYAATVRPEATDDASQGYGPGSAWLNTTTGLFWVCLSAALGAAVWSPESPQDHPGYVSGEFYDAFEGQLVNAAVPAADTIYWTAWALKGRFPLASLNARVATAGSADSEMKVAVYANRNGRPFGAALAAPAAGVATAAASGVSQAVSAVTLPPGPIWIARKHKGATLPVMLSLNNNGTGQQALAGRPTPPTSTTALTARSTPGLYADPWPTMTGAEAFAAVLTTGVALVTLGAA